MHVYVNIFTIKFTWPEILAMSSSGRAAISLLYLWTSLSVWLYIAVVVMFTTYDTQVDAMDLLQMTDYSLKTFYQVVICSKPYLKSL